MVILRLVSVRVYTFHFKLWGFDYHLFPTVLWKCLLSNYGSSALILKSLEVLF